DGFYSRVDPKDPNTIYANMQNGGMVRFDRRTGERISIQPQPKKGDPALRWNWDAPLIISPHSNTRLYFGAQKLYRSDDRGESWVSVSRNLPERGGVFALAEDHVDSKLLFAGTEFGLYFTKLGGEKWIKLNIGLPTVMVRDLAIHKGMDDLVIGTFGRSIYVLDDYSPLRNATNEMLQKEAALLPAKPALSFIPQNRGGDLGTAHFTASNPPARAQITYSLGTGYTTKRAERQRRDRAAIARGETPPYPTPEQLRAEAEEEAPAIVVSIADASGKVIRRMEEPATRGLHRFTWDLRAQSGNPPA